VAFTDVISQPPYPGAKPEEVAEIIINRTMVGGGATGGVFSDWESVFVQHRPSRARFDPDDGGCVRAFIPEGR